MARHSARLYLITLRAAARTVGSAKLVRGQSFTLPITTDVSAYKRMPKVWDVKQIAGHRAPVRPPPQRGPVVSARASAAWTGLVNRLEASALEVERLGDGEGLDGFQAMTRGQAHALAPRLARIFGGTVELWLGVLTDPEDASTALELLELSRQAAEAELQADELEAAEASKPTRGIEADEEDDQVEAEALELVAEPGDVGVTEDGQEIPIPPGALVSEAPELPPEPKAALDDLRDGLVALQAGDEGMTMAKALWLAQAAGLEVPTEIARIRRRAALAAALANLLAGQAQTPSPSELED